MTGLLRSVAIAFSVAEMLVCFSSNAIGQAELTLVAPDSSPVTIRRNSFGVPHIHDVYL